MARTLPRQTGTTMARTLSQLPWELLAVIVVIGSFGVIALYSVSGGSFSPWAERHALRLAVGLALAIAIGIVPIRFWLAMANPLYLVALGLLIAVPFVGTSTMGAKRWIGTTTLSVQPSEFIKFAIVLVLARLFFSSPPDRRSHPAVVFTALALVAVPAALVIRQPDLGSGLLIATLGVVVIFLAGVRWSYFVSGAGAAAVLGYVLWHNLRDYQVNRILTFLEPERDPLGAGYHITQAKIALGSGGLSGKGYLMGSQSQLNFVPEKHTDFAFTMLAEETGFIGSVTLLALYAVLIVIMIGMAMRVRNDFGRLVIGGAAALVAIHVNVNVAMVIGLLPVVGVPLPLVSFGGSSILTTMVAIGLAASAFAHRADVLRRDEIGTLI
ncbi:MAG TPA: rod shape-determining protein RodA [Hyphomicrobiaceae bacterium]|nr:rod shape-determining protein RodA [Hyphomicrobiaceae bacterium]